jgi:hypothetical protein
VLRAIQALNELFDAVIAHAVGQSEFSRFDGKGLAGRTGDRQESEAQDPIHDFLEGSASAADLFFEKPSYVVVD